MTSVMISEGCFCRAQTWEMLGVFVGIVGVSPAYWNSLVGTAGETHGAGEMTCALRYFSSGHCSTLGQCVALPLLVVGLN